MKLLKEQGADDMVVVCGGVIPREDYQALYDVGVSAIFGPGTKVHLAAEQVVDAINAKLKK